MDYLIYIGDGSALHDVPARNLTKEEAEKHGIQRLLTSGLYRLAETPRKTKEFTKEVKHDDN